MFLQTYPASHKHPVFILGTRLSLHTDIVPLMPVTTETYPQLSLSYYLSLLIQYLNSPWPYYLSLLIQYLNSPWPYYLSQLIQYLNSPWPYYLSLLIQYLNSPWTYYLLSYLDYSLVTLPHIELASSLTICDYKTHYWVYYENSRKHVLIMFVAATATPFED